MICAEPTQSHCKRRVTSESTALLIIGFQQMSVFSFDVQNGLAMDSMNINGQDSNISPFNDSTWAQNDYRDQTFDYTYASSNASFSCGSLTNGTLTPQSSVSASTSRRQSLVSPAVRSMSIFDPSTHAKGFRRPRTPVALSNQYMTRQALSNGIYACSTPSTSPTSQRLDNMFAMDMEDSAFSGKLQAALGIDSISSTQASSFSSYDDCDMVPEALLGHQAQSIGSTYMDDQFTKSLGAHRNFPYNSVPSEPTYSPTRNNSLASSQTVIPSQTTYQVAQSTYTVPQTPPRVLGDAFISPSKTTFGTLPEEHLQSILDQSENLEFGGGSADTGPEMMLRSLELQQSPTESEYTDDDSTPFSQSTDQSPCSEEQTFVARRRPYRKSPPGTRPADSGRKKLHKPMACTIKKESVSKHACPKCKHRKFKRPEHLNRHMSSVHGDNRNKVPCIVKDCETSILSRPDNLKTHYQNTHMYGPVPVKGKKRIWLSIEEAREYGLGHIDPRTNPRSVKSRLKEE